MKKGYTIIEIITTLSITTIIVVFLLGMVVVLKDAYTEYLLVNKLRIYQANMSEAIMKDFDSKRLISTSPCEEENCIIFNWDDEDSKVLKISEDIITYGDYSLKLPSGSYFGSFNVSVNEDIENEYGNDSYVHVLIPIYNNLNDGDYGINLIYQYKRQ